jgi:nitrogen regulatory protein PII
MKAVLIICVPALENMVMDLIKKNGADNYTKFPYLLGEGGHSEPHLDTHVWPGSNVGIFVVVDDAKVKKIVAAVKELKKEYFKEGVKAFVLPIEEEI